MADIEFGGINATPQQEVQSSKITKLMNTAGAMMSAALIVGVGVWGYRLLVRDVTGVPVVRALEGPMRVQPDNPGGQQTAHQGLSVNRVQAEGLAGPTADRLVLAPTGAGVSEADPAGLQRPAPSPRRNATPVAEATEPVAAGTGEIIAPALLSEALPTPGLPETLSDGDGVVVAAVDPAITQMSATDAAVAEALALADQISDGAAPLTDVDQLAVIPASVPGVRRSLRPIRRPADLNTSSGEAPVRVNVATVTDVDPATIAPGTRLAQLGAYDSLATAQTEWDQLYGRFTEYMEGKARVIQKAESGGRTFYRLRAMGFDDISDARRFCSALLAENAACIPVKVR